MPINQPAKPAPYSQRMGKLREERRQLESEKTMLEARTGNATNIQELEDVMQDITPKLEDVNRRIEDNEAEQTELAEGMNPDSASEPGEACKVKVYTQPLAGTSVNHSGVLISDNDSESYARAGTPHLPFGDLHAETERNEPGAKDWDTSPLEVTEAGTFDGDCAPLEKSFKRTAKRINEGEYQYRAVVEPQNCHVGTTEFLGDIGQSVPEGVPGQNPGLGKSLPEASPDPMPTDIMP